MRILLAGAAGQLGNELYPRLAEIGEVTAADIRCTRSNAPGCLDVDLGDAGQLERLLNRSDPDLVVNVVDGRASDPYRVTDTPSPLNTYGESKLAGELGIRASGCHAMIVRTSWVYSVHGSNFVLSMLALARQRPQLQVVDDQVGCPTWARNLALASRQLLDAELHGGTEFSGNTFHYCDRDAVSWYDFASLVFRTAADLGLLEKTPELLKVDSTRFRQAARRPAYSVLDTSVIQAEAGVTPRPLADSLLACMREMEPDAR
jgi:dTDP-4-dehydrorhamnose reductase